MNVYTLHILNVGLMLLWSIFPGTRLFIPFTKQILEFMFSIGRGISLIRRVRVLRWFHKPQFEYNLFLWEKRESFLLHLFPKLHTIQYVQDSEKFWRKLFHTIYTYSTTRKEFRRNNLLVSALLLAAACNNHWSL